jgi:surface antigen
MDMRLPTFRFSMLLLAGAAVATAVFAQNYGFLRDSPASRFNQEDMRLHADAAKQALDAPELGKTVSWSNAATGNSGSATATAGQKEGCRALTVESKSTIGTAKNDYHLCKVDGKWKAGKT